jgi:hypothetical protein
MPRQPVVAVELGQPVLAQCELWTELAVQRVADRGEQRHRVDAAVEEDRDDHRIRGSGGLRHAGLEHVEIEQLRSAVHRQGHPRPTHEERAAAQPRARGQRHAALHPGQPVAGLGGSVADEGRAREAVAVPVRHQQVCMSGEVATRMRSAFWRMIG